MRRGEAGRALVVGAGMFGLSAALALRARGYAVQVFDQGPIPHPLAASTDISKIIRMEYGSDETYMAWAEQARAGWLAWNARWRSEGAEPLYHETGILMVCRVPMAPGGFEYESLVRLRARGHAPERLDASGLASRYPAWSASRFVDGFYHAKGGYAESGRVVAALARWAVVEGVDVLADSGVTNLLERGGRVVGVRLRDGRTVGGDHVVVSAGAWSGSLVGLEDDLRPTGHAVFHLRPRAPSLFAADCFPVFTADITRTGYYGFPLNRDGVVKIANHGPGTPVDPEAPRVVGPRDREALRVFLSDTFPALADAETVTERLCLYTDTRDEDFWIARDPDREGLTVATGGSGHGFKFGPVLGDVIADAVVGRTSPLLERFRWRRGLLGARGREAARWRGRESTENGS